MQNHTTIIGVIELRSQKYSHDTVQKRYSIGSGTVTLIMQPILPHASSTVVLCYTYLSCCFPSSLAYAKNPASASAILFSSSTAFSVLSALTEIYTFILGSVPDGRMTTEQFPSNTNFSTFDFGSPSRPLA